MIDGPMLEHLSIDDMPALDIHSELHYLSIKRAIHVLKLVKFDLTLLIRRPTAAAAAASSNLYEGAGGAGGSDELARQNQQQVSLWTNHRVMEWLRSIDLSEYAPNLRGSGMSSILIMMLR